MELVKATRSLTARATDLDNLEESAKPKATATAKDLQHAGLSAEQVGFAANVTWRESPTAQLEWLAAQI
jgi:hypothetical protein